ncbi:hypothetical protein HDU79_001978 [Rhizoclosmatium sp. JEL0117]|nr:hypothetical protein HDU79_001978 [Rhizoclosmatium sp. JEL0117]
MVLTVGIIFAGYAIQTWLTDDVWQFVSDNIMITKGVAVAFLFIGSVMLILSLVGAIGACTRQKRTLMGYFYAILFMGSAVIICGVVFLVKLSNNLRTWDGMQMSDWISYSNYEKDRYQSIYACCGYGSLKANAYTGPVLFNPSARKTGNPCLDTIYVANSPDCLNGGVSWYKLYLSLSGALFAVTGICLLTCVTASAYLVFRTIDSPHSIPSMYQYAQYRHESKKWFSRVYLVLVNLALFGFAIALIIAGIAVMKVAAGGADTIGRSVISISREMGIAVTAVGAILMLFTVAGTMGAITRHNLALKFYIFGIMVGFVIVLAGGIWFIIMVRNNANKWANQNLGDWKAYTDFQKDTYQVLYTCCGYGPDKNGPYLGAPLFDASGRTDGNQCAQNQYFKDAMNCYDGGNAWHHVYTVVSSVLLAGISIFLLTAVGAADNAKMRKSDIGYQVQYEQLPVR